MADKVSEIRAEVLTVILLATIVLIAIERFNTRAQEAYESSADRADQFKNCLELTRHPATGIAFGSSECARAAGRNPATLERQASEFWDKCRRDKKQGKARDCIKERFGDDGEPITALRP